MAKQTAPLPYLLTLPPELLTPIFQQADISLSNLVICRSLLPYTLHALLVQVDLYSQAQIRSFHRAVQDDSKARLVRVLTMSTVKDRDEEDEEESCEEESEGSGPSGTEWDSESAGEELEATEPARETRKVQDERRKYRSYAIADALQSLALDDSPPPSSYSHPLDFDEVLADMVRRLVNLEVCSAIGKDVACLFRDDFYRPGILPRLVEADIQLQPSEEFEEEDTPLFIAASRLPSLKRLDVMGKSETLPFDLAVFSTLDPLKQPIPPHSWALQSLSLSRIWMFGRELRFLFSSFTRLETLTLEGYQADPSSFSQALSLLPKTLQNLTITLLGDPEQGASLPTLDYLPLWLPRLKHLHLTGDIFTHTLFHHLHRASSLECLLFGHATQISTESLRRLVDPASPIRITSLQFLDVHVCWRTPADRNGRPLAGARKRAIWTDEVSKKGARRLGKACKEVGVELGGGMACALKECTCAEMGRKCERVV